MLSEKTLSPQKKGKKKRRCSTYIAGGVWTYRYQRALKQYSKSDNENSHILFSVLYHIHTLTKHLNFLWNYWGHNAARGVRDRQNHSVLVVDGGNWLRHLDINTPSRQVQINKPALNSGTLIYNKVTWYHPRFFFFPFPFWTSKAVWLTRSAL